MPILYASHLHPSELFTYDISVSNFQLAILASYSGDELVAVYRYFRSLAVDSPFSTARDNLIVAFEKVFSFVCHLLQSILYIFFSCLFLAHDVDIIFKMLLDIAIPFITQG